MSEDARTRWMATLLEAALEHEIASSDAVLEHVTPNVLAQHVPPDLMGALLTSALADSSLTPKHVLATLPPKILAEHIPHDLIWGCVAAAAERAKIADKAEEAAS